MCTGKVQTGKKNVVFITSLFQYQIRLTCVTASLSSEFSEDKAIEVYTYIQIMCFHIIKRVSREGISKDSQTFRNIRMCLKFCIFCLLCIYYIFCQIGIFCLFSFGKRKDFSQEYICYLAQIQLKSQPSKTVGQGILFL